MQQRHMMAPRCVYKNGVEVGALDKNGDIVGHGEGIWIGGNPNVATSHPWDGLMSESINKRKQIRSCLKLSY